MTWGDMDGDGDRDFAFAGHGGGFLGWFENRGNSDSRTDGDFAPSCNRMGDDLTVRRGIVPEGPLTNRRR